MKFYSPWVVRFSGLMDVILRLKKRNFRQIIGLRILGVVLTTIFYGLMVVRFLGL